MASPDDAQLLRQFLLGIGGAMIAARESVDAVKSTLTRVARAYGVGDTEFIILPTVVLVQVDGVIQGRGMVRDGSVVEFRFDQIAALHGLLKLAQAGHLDPADGIRRLNEIGAQRPRFAWPVRVLGHAVLTAGLSLLLVPTWQGLALCAALGLLVGLVKLVRSPALQLVFPVAAAFACGIVVFWLAQRFEIGSPLLLLIAPLVTFLPGGMLANATRELATGQAVAGSARLVSGLVTLALLSSGILAAGAVMGATSYDYAPVADEFPWWVALVGILLLAVGNYLHFSAPAATFGWVLAALLVAYGGQTAGGALFGPALSGFSGALVVTPFVLWVETLRRGAPAQLTFLPAFWLLVPGAASVIGLTSVVGGGSSMDVFWAALAGVLGVALGVLVGSAVSSAVRSGARGIENFTVELPAAIADHERGGLWRRLIPGTRDSLWSSHRD
ncbi:threonine/serine exporter family protein [Protaetiibacter intestinalis]|uniref:Threonine/serine exporter family protein n=1 Tax=Protaetiibacter intestinalis TaxID=2419774 RepID=A0A387BEA7_9MICO|nr:threonine/serine exporter family protein [Protaetiibacter intestinalis]AYF99239.1 threonine/serine exporter family protein [Protaetiibacter intestinalis]